MHMISQKALFGPWDLLLTLVVMISMTRDGDIVGQISGECGAANSQ